MPETPARDTVDLTPREAPRGVNPGYQKASRPLTYAATQPLLVDKEPLFARILTAVEKAWPAWCAAAPEGISVVEPGCGPGFFMAAFLRWLATRTDSTPVHLVGADLSTGMIDLAHRRLDPLVATLRPQRPVTLSLTGSVDLLPPEAPFFQEIGAPKAHLVIAAQFEHYFPNRPDSPLASALTKTGRIVRTKADFRRWAHHILAPGGLYATIDDALGASPQEEARWQAAWDRHVIERFASPGILESLGRSAPTLAQVLRRHYAPHRPEGDRLRHARRAREIRRRSCLEEVETLAETRAGLESIFGEGRVLVESHPDPRTHPQFFLALAHRGAD